MKRILLAFLITHVCAQDISIPTGASSSAQAVARYACTFPTCNKSFIHHPSFYRHISRTHAESRPYQCPYPGCGRSFFLAESSTEHQLSHTGQRPYKCRYCGSAFMRNWAVEKHVERFHTKKNASDDEIDSELLELTRISANSEKLDAARALLEIATTKETELSTESPAKKQPVQPASNIFRSPEYNPQR